MQKKQQERLEKQLRALKIKNRFFKERQTFLKKENANLKKTLANKERLFKMTPSGIILVQSGKVIDINDWILERLGYQAEEVIGRNYIDFIHPDRRPMERDQLKNWGLGKIVPDQYESDLLTYQGEKLCVEIRVSRLRYNNKTAFLFSLSPLEKRKEQERERIQSEKREALLVMALGMKKEIDHCYRSIFERIKDIKVVMGSKNAGFLKDIKKIEHASKTMLNAVLKLDTITTTEYSKKTLVSFNLNKIVTSAVSLTTQKWKDEPEKLGIEINLKTHLRSNALIKGNPDEIQNVIIQMILNAVQAMPKGGDIHLTTEDNAGYAHIYIQDNGEGFSGRIRPKIFDPFYTTKKAGAAGLGLSIAYAVVKRHKGEIEVSSEKDQGTIFHISIPVAVIQSNAITRIDRKKLKKSRILIIQNDDISRELLSQVLMNKGCQVDMATSGLEGFAKLRKKKFDLVIADSEISDIDMPRFSQRSKKINRKLSVALITNNKENHHRVPNKDTAIDLIIPKPLDVNKTVKNVLEILITNHYGIIEG